MLRPRPQLPQNPGDEQSRVLRLAHDIVEAAADSAPSLAGGRGRRDDGDQHAMPEVGLGVRFHLARPDHPRSSAAAPATH